MFTMSLPHHIAALIVGLLLFGHVTANTRVQNPLQTVSNTTSNCYQACSLFQDSLRQDRPYDVLSVRSTPPFFSTKQEELVPSCVLQPESAEEVSRAFRFIIDQQCIFAVKSGGHSIIPGASNVHNGLVLDLGKLNSIDVSEDASTAFIGAGSRWRDVYLYLQERGLLVAGGRVGSVGVGGFTLGGGISALSRRYGWALDNVRNYELVLANGTITNVSKDTNPELYFALRGGGNNFAIVTRFDFEAHPHGLLWGGTNAFIGNDLGPRRAALGLRDEFRLNYHSMFLHLMTFLQNLAVRFGYGVESSQIVDFFVDLASDEQVDPAAHAYIFLSWIPKQKMYLFGTTHVYSEPIENPPVFRNLNSKSSIFSTNRLSNLSDFAHEVEVQCGSGLRQSWGTATFKVDASLISKFWDIFLLEVDVLKLAVPDSQSSVNIQLITKDEVALFSKNGGNSFGIKKGEGPLFLYSVTIAYENAKDDEFIDQVVNNIIQRAVDLGKEMALYHPFLYMNYAGPAQDIFAGYGIENREKLLKIQKTYDPDGVFTKLQPGYFKL